MDSKTLVHFSHFRSLATNAELIDASSIQYQVTSIQDRFNFSIDLILQKKYLYAVR